MKLDRLKEIYYDGGKISFDIVNHPRIPNMAMCNNGIIGKVSLQTINAFKNWEKLVNRYSLEKIDPSDILTVGNRVIHKTTLKIGIYVGECLGFEKCKIDYGTGHCAEQKSNIMKILSIDSNEVYGE